MLSYIALAVKSDYTTLALAQEWLQQNCSSNQLSGRMKFVLRLCLDEALTNILEHGFNDTTNSTPLVTLSFKQVPGFVVLTIQDNGCIFNPTVQPLPSLPESVDTAPIGGHGLRLIRSYAHDLHYYFFNGTNCLQITIALE